MDLSVWRIVFIFPKMWFSCILLGTRKKRRKDRNYQMANQEQVRLLKQGSKVWNAWKWQDSPLQEGYKEVLLDLRNADLKAVNLSGVDLIRADLREADLSGANLDNAVLVEADLSGVNLSGANFSFADLEGANLSHTNMNYTDLQGARLVGSDLSNTDLTEAYLNEAYLNEANLTDTNLCGANLTRVDFTKANLTRTNFTQAIIGWTRFRNVDLRYAYGLADVRHLGPSTFDTDTLACSKDSIPETFLHHVKVADTPL